MEKEEFSKALSDIATKQDVERIIKRLERIEQRLDAMEDPQEREQQVPHVHEIKDVKPGYCPHCEYYLGDSKVIFCVNCGKNVTLKPHKETLQRKRKGSEILKKQISELNNCPYCGTPLAIINAAFCHGCGNKL